MKDNLRVILCILLILVLITQIILLNKIERVIKSQIGTAEYLYSRLERVGILLLQIRDHVNKGDELTEQD